MTSPSHDHHVRDFYGSTACAYLANTGAYLPAGAIAMIAAAYPQLHILERQFDRMVLFGTCEEARDAGRAWCAAWKKAMYALYPLTEAKENL